MVYVAVLIFGFFLLSLLGYITHYAFHQKWSGVFYRKHMTHHLVLYPADRFMSDAYRDSGKDNTVWMFAAVFAPFVLTALLLTVFSVISLGIGLCIFAEMTIIGVLNNYLHDAFHLSSSVWHRWPGFQKLKALHLNHHIRMDTNYGIFSFYWDKWIGTYWKAD